MINDNYSAYSSTEFITIITEQKTVITEQKTEIDSLKHQLTNFQKIVFGSKQEQHKAIEKS